MIGTADALRRTKAMYALVGLVAFTGSAIGCSSSDDDNVTNPPVGVVTAVRDQSFDFTKLHTFSMPDTVVQFVPKTGTPLTVPRTFDQVALNEVRANLLARGYVEETHPVLNRPDFVVLVGSTATTNYDAYATYPWYSYWGFYPGWGFYEPGFTNAWNLIYPWYPTVGVTSYDRGTLVVTLVPTVTINPLSQSVSAEWAGVASAVLNGQVSSTSISNAVDQMFQLSPYLVSSGSSASRLSY